MNNGSHTFIGILRHHVEAWRKREGMSRQSVAMVIVDAHERIGGPADTGIEFDPPSKDAYSRVATNSERIWRWLDDVTKETNYLPANFAKSILAAMPLDIRMAALDEYLRGVGMACRQLPGSAECAEFTPGALGSLLKETSEAAVAFTALLDGHNKAELQAAQKELSQAVTMMSYQLAKVESALNGGA